MFLISLRLCAFADVFFENKVPDLIIVPVTLNYEKIMESLLYSNELLGDSKIRESFRALVKSRSVLTSNYGHITINFGEPISLKDYATEFQQTGNTHAMLSYPEMDLCSAGLAPRPSPSLALPPHPAAETTGQFVPPPKVKALGSLSICRVCF